MNAKLQTTVLILVLLYCPAIASSAMAQDEGLALTLPMARNSWNHIAGKNDSRTVRAQADAMAASGIKDAGYVYINIDNTWEGKRHEPAGVSLLVCSTAVRTRT